MNITNIIVEDPSYTKILNDCKHDIDCDFIYADEHGFIEYLSNHTLHAEISKKIVIIAFRDIWSPGNIIDDAIEQACKVHPNSTFVLFHVFFDKTRMSTALQACDNLHFIHVSQIIDGKEEFKNTKEVSNKNFDSEQIGLSLNRKFRPHRTITLGMIYALHLEKYIVHTGNGIINNVCNLDTPIIQSLNWEFDIDIEPSFQAMCNNIKRHPKWSTSYKHSITRYNNFNDILRPYYLDSFVEIISETTFENRLLLHSTEKTGIVTEKYLQSVYGYNFPILISAVGTVKYLKEFLGLDLFDDIVDHSYDSIMDPFERLSTAISSNKHLFTDTERTKTLWKECKPRFNANLKLAREDMYDIYYNHAVSEFKKYAPLAQLEEAAVLETVNVSVQV